MSSNDLYHDVVKTMEKKVQITPRNVIPLADAHELVALANSIQNARDFVKCQAVGKLEMIAEQMEFLRKQAIEVLQKAQHDNELHCVECKVKKAPGKIYYLYQQRISADADNGRPQRRFFSLISPSEWGGECALAGRQMHFEGAYRLEFDQSWTKVQQQNANANDEEPNLKSNQKMLLLGGVDNLLKHASSSNATPLSMNK